MGSLSFSDVSVESACQPAPSTWDVGSNEKPKHHSDTTTPDHPKPDHPKTRGPYVQDGTLPYFDPSIPNQIPLASNIDFAQRLSIDMWVQDLNGTWHQPGDPTAPYTIQMVPTPTGCTMVLVLPAGTHYAVGTSYTLVIEFRARA